MSDDMLAPPEKLRQWRQDPRVFVREQFGAVPDAWQDDVLAAFPRAPRTRPGASVASRRS